MALLAACASARVWRYSSLRRRRTLARARGASEARLAPAPPFQDGRHGPGEGAGHDLVLHQEIAGTQLHGLHGHLLVAGAGDDNDRGVAALLLESAQDIEAGHIGELVIEEDGIELASGETVQGLPARG